LTFLFLGFLSVAQPAASRTLAKSNMRYSQLLPIAGAATALATPIVPRKECAANDDSYDFVSAD